MNLAAFIPMAALALFIHAKNGRVEKEGLWILCLPAVALSVAGSFLASAAPSGVLRKIFGGFLIALGVFQFLSPKIPGLGNSGKEKEEKSS